MPNVALQEPKAAESVFEFNILVLGMIAKAYGAGAPSSPMRHWGAEASNRQIVYEGKSYHAAMARKDGVPGVRLTVRDFDTSNVLQDVFMTYESLNRVGVLLEVEHY